MCLHVNLSLVEGAFDHDLEWPLSAGRVEVNVVSGQKKEERIEGSFEFDFSNKSKTYIVKNIVFVIRKLSMPTR